jgi:eukaryotic-like serine/threonine-protein kinase
MPLACGTHLGPYEILAPLGEGGMGEVYQAKDTRLGRDVALKVLPHDRFADPQWKLRFIQESRAASALNHPNIITIHDIGTENDFDFIVMEYVRGKTIGELIPETGLDLSEALGYAVQIADALAKAHSAGIVHRDLKPANLMVNEDGLVKVLDFGVAKLTAKGSPWDTTGTMRSDEVLRTESGAIIGTISYMSPEQAEGRKVDARSDIFSLAAVLYEMVKGRRAFDGESKMSTLAAIVRDEPAPLSAEIPVELTRLITHCLRKDPSRRIQHMDDFKLALEDVKEELDSGTLATGVLIPTAEPRRAAQLRLAAIVVTVVGLAALGWYWFGPAGAKPPDAPMKLGPLTSYTGSEIHPNLSPDGKQVVFAWNGTQRDNYDIWVKLVAGEPALRLTTDPSRDISPVWSPDGDQIAFIRQGEGIFLISPLGGRERKLAAVNSGFPTTQTGNVVWTPDGKSVVVVDRSAVNEPPCIFLVSVATGEKRRLTSSQPHRFGDNGAAISPDGKRLAFARWPTSSAADLYVMPVEGGESTRLTQDSARIFGLAWTPDGRDIVFSSDREGSTRLWRVSATGSTPSQPERLAGISAGARFPTISSEAPARLAYANWDRDFNIWSVNNGASQPGMSGPVQLIASTRHDTSPQLSPDGTRIVFASTRSGFNEIWISDSDGLNADQLTSFGGNSSGTPRWSPDGLHITFDSLSDDNRDIYVVSAEGGAPRRLTTEATEEWRPSYSADGNWIYFGSDRSGTAQIWKASLEGGVAQQVTTLGGYECFESLDGKRVYYTKARHLRELWSMPVEGGEEELVARPVWTGFWAVSDKGMYSLDFSVAAGAPVLIKRWDRVSGRTPQIGTVERAIAHGTPGFSVSRDGRRFLYIRPDRADSDLMLVENFR